MNHAGSPGAGVKPAKVNAPPAKVTIVFFERRAYAVFSEMPPNHWSLVPRGDAVPDFARGYSWKIDETREINGKWHAILVKQYSVRDDEGLVYEFL